MHAQINYTIYVCVHRDLLWCKTCIFPLWMSHPQILQPSAYWLICSGNLIPQTAFTDCVFRSCSPHPHFNKSLLCHVSYWISLFPFFLPSTLSSCFSLVRLTITKLPMKLKVEIESRGGGGSRERTCQYLASTEFHIPPKIRCAVKWTGLSAWQTPGPLLSFMQSWAQILNKIRQGWVGLWGRFWRKLRQQQEEKSPHPPPSYSSSFPKSPEQPKRPGYTSWQQNKIKIKSPQPSFFPSDISKNNLRSRQQILKAGYWKGGVFSHNNVNLVLHIQSPQVMLCSQE